MKTLRFPPVNTFVFLRPLRYIITSTHFPTCKFHFSFLLSQRWHRLPLWSCTTLGQNPAKILHLCLVHKMCYLQYHDPLHTDLRKQKINRIKYSHQFTCLCPRIGLVYSIWTAQLRCWSDLQKLNRIVTAKKDDRIQIVSQRNIRTVCKETGGGEVKNSSFNAFWPVFCIKLSKIGKSQNWKGKSIEPPQVWTERLCV